MPVPIFPMENAPIETTPQMGLRIMRSPSVLSTPGTMAFDISCAKLKPKTS